jgi:cell division protein FtsW
MTQKEKKKKHRISFAMIRGRDPLIHMAVILLAVFGILMIGSASMGTTISSIRTIIINVAKQLIFVMIGYYLMAWCSRKFRLGFLKSYMFSIIVIIEIALLAICRLFPEVNGSHAWLRIGFGSVEVTLQPAEFAKICTFLLIAGHLADRRNTRVSSWNLVKRPFILILIFLGIILLIQHDFGSASVVYLIAWICLLIPRNKKLRGWKILVSILPVVAVIGWLYILTPNGTQALEHLSFLQDYQKGRFLSAVNPFQDAYDQGYQLIQSLIAFSDGGWFGRGFGSSVRKYMNFPEATNDFILAIVVEETGYIGFIFLMFLYAVIIFRLLMYARKIRSEAGRIILVGTASYFLIHVFLNVGGVTGLIPLTGVPLPLISSGGSSAMAFMIAIGLSQAVIAKFNREKDLVDADYRG